MRIRDQQIAHLDRVFREGKPGRFLERLRAQGVDARKDPKTGEIAVQSILGTESRVAFDSAGNIVRQTTPTGRTTSYEYDKQGRIQAFVYPGGRRVQLTYDDKGNLIRMERPGSSSFQFAYHAAELTAVTFPDGKSIRLGYRPETGSKTWTDRAGVTTEHRYNRQGSLEAIIDPAGRATTFEFTQTGRKARIRFPDGSAEHRSMVGRAVGMVQRDGLEIREEYSQTGDLEFVTWPDGSWTRLAYQNGNLAMAANDSSTLIVDSDARGNVTREDQTGSLIEALRDAEGRLSRIVTDQGELISYQYDPDGRLASIEDWDRRKIEFSYPGDGTLVEVRYPNGAVERRETADNGRIASTTITDHANRILSEHRYRYDIAERLVEQVENWEWPAPGGYGRTFRYDEAGRIAEDLDSQTGRLLGRFSFDRLGNMVADSGVTLQYGVMNQPVLRGADRVEWNRNGNLVEGPSLTGRISCSYNAQGLLSSCRSGGVDVRFEYDPLGRRVRKMIGKSVWKYGWLGNQLLWEEYQESPERKPVRRDYLYASESLAPIAFREEGRCFWLHSDQRGAVIAVLDEERSIVWRATYDSFGLARIHEGEIRQPFRLLGYYCDDETGLHYSYARYYNPVLRSYISREPKWMSITSTDYSYAANDPWNRVDPLGTDAELLAVLTSIAEAAAKQAFEAGKGPQALAGAIPKPKPNLVYDDESDILAMARDAAKHFLSTSPTALAELTKKRGGTKANPRNILTTMVRAIADQIASTLEAFKDQPTLMCESAVIKSGTTAGVAKALLYLQELEDADPGTIADLENELLANAPDSTPFDTGLKQIAESSVDYMEAMGEARRGTGINMRGAVGEFIVELGSVAKDVAKAQGLKKVISVGQLVNNSGNGLDLFILGEDSAGDAVVIFGEIKTSITGNEPALSAAQRNSDKYVKDQLRAISRQQGRYKNVTDKTAQQAEELLDVLDEQEGRGFTGENTKYIVFLDPDTGAIEDIQTKPW